MRILLWLSGWVDSAVAAHILLQQWHEVIAGFMKNYANEDDPTCHTREDREMAMEVAKFLWITQFVTFDFVQEYHERIIQYIYDWYAAWITPNPDVLCNSLIKFDLFLEEGIKLWCDAVATGHYARVTQEESIYSLLKWIDSNKDQSYFLSWLDQEQLGRSLFPLWDLTKDEVRKIAHDIGLPNADRKDSQWLCFIGKVPIKEFLSEALPKKLGNIGDTEGKILWQHDGAHFVTIGQRTGLWLSWWPWYVIAKNIDTNEIIVSKDEKKDLMHDSLITTNIHRTSWSPPSLPLTCHAQIRYRQADQQCKVSEQWDNLFVQFTEPQRAISPGQIVVFYDGDEVVGNGVIKSII